MHLLKPLKITRTKLAQRIRTYRRWHRSISVVLSVWIFLIALTGIFLGWKKHWRPLQPPTQKVSPTPAPAEWLPLADIQAAALSAMESRGPGPWTVDRIDVRPGKGIAKVRLDQKSYEVQVELHTASVRSVGRRHADWIEAIHDGSIIGDTFKLLGMNIVGLGLVLMIFTGLALWLGPKIIRRRKRQAQS